MPKVDDERFPEWTEFAAAVKTRQPDAGTWCEAWTVRDVVIHQTGNAEELARVLPATSQARRSTPEASRNARPRTAR